MRRTDNINVTSQTSRPTILVLQHASFSDVSASHLTKAPDLRLARRRFELYSSCIAAKLAKYFSATVATATHSTTS